MSEKERSRPAKAAPETAPTTKLVGPQVTTWRRVRAGQRIHKLERRVWAISVRVDALEERLDALEVKP
ncbi:unannotated protein [freshwater metagenome]|uniref:Unannotated protein n=1 Tax=freshwater metagenome TaxID=449393 RepID=A0A6J7KVD4_9ZZZZ